MCSLRVAESLLARTSNGFVCPQGPPLGGQRGSSGPGGGSIFSAECSVLPLIGVTQLLSHRTERPAGADDTMDGSGQMHDDVLGMSSTDLLSVRMEVAIERELGTLDRAASRSIGAIPARFELANQIMRRMEGERERRGQGDEWGERRPDTLPSPSHAPDGGGSVCTRTRSSMEAFSYIFSILDCERTGAVGLLGGRDLMKALRALFDTCGVFEEMWITPKDRSTAQSAIQGVRSGAGDVLQKPCNDRSEEAIRDSRGGGGDVESGLKTVKESLSSMVISFCSTVQSHRPHQRHRQRQKNRRAGRGYRKEPRKAGMSDLRGDAVLLALQYYRMKSEAAHTIARRAREQTALLTEELKAAMKAEAACTAGEGTNVRVEEQQLGIEEAALNATNSTHCNPLCALQATSTSISIALNSWRAAAELSRGILFAIWREVTRAALLAPLLLTEAVCLILSAGDCAGADTGTGEDDDAVHYHEVLRAFLQLWVGCSVGGEQRVTSAQRVSMLLSPQPPVVLSKDDLHSPAASWASVTEHVRYVLSQPSQCDSQAVTALHGSGVALILALHTYVLASSPQSGGVVPVTQRASKAPTLGGAWDLLKTLCCDPRLWGDSRELPVWDRKNELSGFQLMSLSLASRACRLWVGAERNAVPLYTDTASSVLTMEEISSPSTGESESASGPGSGLLGGEESQCRQESGTGICRPIPWGLYRESLKGEKGEKVEQGELTAAKATAAALEWRTQGPRLGDLTTRSPPISIGALSLFLTSRAALSSSSIRSHTDGVTHTRTYLQTVLAQLSSCVFLELGLQSPITNTHGISDPRSAPHGASTGVQHDIALDQNIRNQLQKYFSKSVSVDQMACSTVTLLSQLLHKMLFNMSIEAAEKTTSAFNTRLRTTCSTALCSLLDMSRIATQNSGSKVPFPSDTTVLPSMTECVCLCLAVRAVVESVPLGSRVFRKPFPSSSDRSVPRWQSLDSAAGAAGAACGGEETPRGLLCLYCRHHHYYYYHHHRYCWHRLRHRYRHYYHRRHHYCLHYQCYYSNNLLFLNPHFCVLSGNKLQALPTDWTAFKIHDALNMQHKNALYLLLATYSLTPFPAPEGDGTKNSTGMEEGTAAAAAAEGGEQNAASSSSSSPRLQVDTRIDDTVVLYL